MMMLDLELFRQDPDRAFAEVVKISRDMEKLVERFKMQEKELAKAKAHIAALLRGRYVPNSEYYGRGQLSLFDDIFPAAEKTEQPTAPEPNQDSKPAQKNSSGTKKHGRGDPPAHLDRQRQEHPFTDKDGTCEECGKTLKVLGENQSNQLDFEPPKVFVIEHVTFKGVCDCKNKVVTSSIPPQPIEKGLAGPGLLAHILVSKYCDHLPLYRQESIFKRMGLDSLGRSTMADWVGQCAELVKPIWMAMKESILQSRVIQTDATTLPVLQVEKPDKKFRPWEKNAAHKGYLWVYLGDRENYDIIYDYTKTQSRDGPNRFFAGYRGYIQADAHNSFDELFLDGTRLEVGCWAHARRKFHNALNGSMRLAGEILTKIALLYAIESKISQWTSADKLAVRESESRPILGAIHEWLKTNQVSREALPKSEMGKGIGYALKHWRALNRYVENGFLSIDNNASERAIKNVVIGRKNWLFAGNEAGAQRAAIIFSLVVTCKNNGIEPFAYLRDILRKLPTWPESKIVELMPRNWALGKKE